MREVVFIKKNKERWQSYEQPTSSPDELAHRFVSLIDDLGYAKTHYPASETVNYLNSIASNIYLSIYKTKKKEKNWLRKFFMEDIPLTIYKHKRTLLFTAIFFVVMYLIGLFLANKDPNFIRAILSDEYVNMTQDNIESGKPFGVYGDTNGFVMFVYIAWNNIRVALMTFSSVVFLLFQCFAYLLQVSTGYARPNAWIFGTLLAIPGVYLLLRMITGSIYKTKPERFRHIIDSEVQTRPIDCESVDGVLQPTYRAVWRNIRFTYLAFLLGLACVCGSLYFLFHNGIMVGTFHQMFIAHGYGIKWIFVVMIHGTLELFSIMVAGACGVIMGNGLLFPGTYKRMSALRKSAKDAIKIMVIVTLMLIVAAVFESFVTRYENMPVLLSTIILLACMAFIILYFYILPRQVALSYEHQEQKLKKQFLQLYP